MIEVIGTGVCNDHQGDGVVLASGHACRAMTPPTVRPFLFQEIYVIRGE
jgi:hypothetical protein